MGSLRFCQRARSRKCQFHAWLRGLMILGAAFQLTIGCATQGLWVNPFDSAPSLSSRVRTPFPKREARAAGASEMLRRVASASPASREGLLVREVLKGNVPQNRLQLIPVRLSYKDAKGKVHQGRVWVTGDYLSVGSERDHLRLSLTPMAAQRVATGLGCVLPTPRLVREIDRQASVRLKPEFISTRNREGLWRDVRVHDAAIERQWQSRVKRVALVTGHKKDIVWTRRLIRQPDRVAIYGWFAAPGRPIQDLSLVHDRGYTDYSHGVRLVWGVMELDGRNVRVADVLKDPRLSGILSDEGALPRTNLYASR